MRLITNSERNMLKSHFKGIYRIPEIISYVDEITSIYTYKYENLVIYVYYRKNKDYLNISKIQRVIKRAYKVTDSKFFIIHLMLSPAKKEFEFDKIMTAKNVNSGFTYPKNNEIFIFRKEEFPKVIIHELIHHQILIDNQEFKPENKDKLMNHFNIDKNTILILNETIVELWALIVHLTAISIEYKINIKTLFDLELRYSCFKSYQILTLQENYKNQKWCDRCNIYSYIIFKMIIMMNLNDFFKTYTYPYDDTKITNFLIKHSNSLFNLKILKPYNPEFIWKNKKIQRPLNSLCFMLFSDF